MSLHILISFCYMCLRTLPLALHTIPLGYKISHKMGSSQFSLSWPVGEFLDPLLHHNFGVTVTHICAQFYNERWRFELRSWCLQSKCSYLLSHHPNLQVSNVCICLTDIVPYNSTTLLKIPHYYFEINHSGSFRCSNTTDATNQNLNCCFVDYESLMKQWSRY